MRTFELLLWIASAGCLSGLVFDRLRRSINLAMIAGIVGVAAAHAAIEGIRFHMVGVYALMAVAMAVALWRLRRPEPRGVTRVWVRSSVAILLAASLVVAAALPTLFPVFRYETPTGPYGIGTADYEMPGSAGRTLVVQFWYPTRRDASGSRAGLTTRPDLLADAYASFTGLPRLFFDHLRLIRTHAIRGAAFPADSAARPVVLFSHGPLSANRVQSVFMMEALASHGFVVAAIDHTGYASTTIFPDGHAVSPDPRAAWPVFVDAKSTAMLHTWVDDVRHVIDRLEALNAGDPGGLLTGRLDLAHIGYVGASFGGSVVVQALLDEPRIRAGVAQDGKPYFADDTPAALQRPLMYMQSAAPYIKSSDAQLARWGLNATAFRMAEQDHYARQMRLIGSATSPIYNVYVRHTSHVTFSDLNLIVRVPDFDLINIRRAHCIINDYTVAFFERYLNGRTEPLVDESTPSSYEEVTVTRRNVAPPTAGLVAAVGQGR